MTTLLDVLGGLRGRLETVEGLNVVDYVPDDIASFPAAVIFPPTNADYNDTLNDGSFTVTFVVLLMVPSTVDRQQLVMYELLDKSGPRSVYAAVMSDRTLDGLDVDCRVMDAADPLDRGLMATSQIYHRAVTVQAIVS